MRAQDIKYMQRCLYLAEMGRSSTAPNPMVGALIVHQDKIIGEGYHHHAGGPHAEVVAIESVKDKALLKESTLYVSLEPCSHYGRTPPCTNLIIEMEIPRVVVATRDFNSEVNGKGIARLKKAGIEVIEGVLESEAQELNRKFFTFHKKQRPYITLKWAQSSNGIMDANRSNGEKGVQWISEAESQVFAHKLRAEHQAILVGRKTAKIDNPSLDTRAYQGANPLRLIIDPQRSLDQHLKVFRDSSYLRFCYQSVDNQDVILKPDRDLLPQIIQTAYERGLQSILVEGGSFTLRAFIEADLWDEAFIIESKQVIEDGLEAPKIELDGQVSRLKNDLLKHYRRWFGYSLASAVRY